MRCQPGYAIGLITALAAGVLTNSPQPALLYLGCNLYNKVHQDCVLEYLEKVDKCNIWLKGMKVAMELMDRYDRVPQILLQDC
ncbi:unnamed protein product [Trifolium pratense]|uniref:Uncharacterized protein n=1 Tax=Trifolium pratense TaxID=57577 RepID=A0ACB0LI14_TRIPR|nr:unnamed protein product [Trifolium pratense]